jgi:hypothetical protein
MERLSEKSIDATEVADEDLDAVTGGRFYKWAKFTYDAAGTHGNTQVWTVWTT